MATLQHNGTEYNILYIDPTLTEGGDGLTPATALLDIPTPLVDNTCYLIRRGPADEIYNVNMPQSWYESLYQIMFIGMPTQDSPLWALLEEDVKTAWGADLGKYARIRCNCSAYQDIYNYYDMGNTNNKTLFKTNTIRNFVADSCYFYRDGESPNANSNGRYCAYFFGFDYDSRFANISFNNCKFGYAQYNFENKDYLDSNTDIAKDTSKYPQYQCANFIAARNLNMISFSNMVINVTNTKRYNYSSETAWAQPNSKIFHVAGYNKSNCENIQLNMLYFNSYDQSGYAYSMTNTRLWFEGGNRSYSRWNNIEINRIYTPTGARIANMAMSTSSNILDVNNIIIKHRVMGTSPMESYNNIYDTSYAVSLSASISYRISNLYTDVKNTSVKYGKMFSLNFFRSSCGTPGNKIENIFVNHNTDGKLSLGTPLVNMVGSASRWNCNSGNDELSGNNTYSESAHDYDYQTVPQKACLVNNLIIDCPIVDAYVLSAYRTGIKSDYIGGKIYLASAVLDVKKLYNGISTSVGVGLVGNSFLKCDDFEANLDYPGYKGTNQISWQRGSQSAVYIGKSNCIVADEVQNSGSNYIACMNSTLVCPNYIKTGQFFARNYNSFCKSWNVVRTGSGAQGSLRFVNNTNGQNDDILPLIIGQEPYTGFQIMPTSTGKKYIIGYIATKNFDESELSNGSGSFGYWVNTTEKYTDLFNPEKTNTLVHTYSSDVFGWLNDNESTWSNDTNLRKYKIIVPIEVFNLEDPIEIKVWFNWYSVNGYCYLDPDFKIVDTIN